MSTAHQPARQDSTVHVRVRRADQLFNSFDPSPFWDRDLDRAAARYIEEEFGDRPRDSQWILEIVTDDDQHYRAADIQQALKVYYQRLAESTRRQQRLRLRSGQLAMLIGVCVFALSTLGRDLLSRQFSGGLPRLLDDGLIIMAWIALWLPLEQLISDLLPMIRDRRFQVRLSQVRVHLRHAKEKTPTA